MALLGLGLFEEGTARQDHVVAVLVELDDLGLDDLTDEGVQVTHPAEVDERCRQEAAQSDVDDQATLDDLDHRTGDGAALVHDLLDAAPCSLVLSALLGEDEAPRLVFHLEDEGFDGITDVDDFAGVGAVANREFLGRNDAFGLEADVDEHLVGVDPHHGAGDDVALFELEDGPLDGGGKVVGTQIVRHVSEVTRSGDGRPVTNRWWGRLCRDLGGSNSSFTGYGICCGNISRFNISPAAAFVASSATSSASGCSDPAAVASADRGFFNRPRRRQRRHGISRDSPFNGISRQTRGGFGGSLNRNVRCDHPLGDRLSRSLGLSDGFRGCGFFDRLGCAFGEPRLSLDGHTRTSTPCLHELPSSAQTRLVEGRA